MWLGFHVDYDLDEKKTFYIHRPAKGSPIADEVIAELIKTRAQLAPTLEKLVEYIASVEAVNVEPDLTNIAWVTDDVIIANRELDRVATGLELMEVSRAKTGRKALASFNYLTPVRGRRELAPRPTQAFIDKVYPELDTFMTHDSSGKFHKTYKISRASHVAKINSHCVLKVEFYPWRVNSDSDNMGYITISKLLNQVWFQKEEELWDRTRRKSLARLAPLPVPVTAKKLEEILRTPRKNLVKDKLSSRDLRGAVPALSPTSSMPEVPKNEQNSTKARFMRLFSRMA